LSLDAIRHDTGLQLLLGFGTTAGVAVQAIVLLPLLRPAGIRLRALWDLRHPAVARVARLSAWTLGYVATNQVSLLVAQILANGHEGDYSAYTAAYMFFQLPYGVLAVSILTAITPDLAHDWSTGDRAGYRAGMGRGIRAVGLVMLPAAAGYLLLAHPIVDLLIRHGALRAAAAGTTADVLALFALGLPAYSGYLLLVRGYTAMQDTRTPFVLNTFENGLAIVLD